MSKLIVNYLYKITSNFFLILQQKKCGFASPPPFWGDKRGAFWMLFGGYCSANSPSLLRNQRQIAHQLPPDWWPITPWLQHKEWRKIAQIAINDSASMVYPNRSILRFFGPKYFLWKRRAVSHRLNSEFSLQFGEGGCLSRSGERGARSEKCISAEK